MRADSGAESGLFLRLVPGTRLMASGGCVLSLETPHSAAIAIDASVPEVLAALLRLAEGRAQVEKLVELAAAAGNTTAVDHLHRCLRQLRQSQRCEYVWEVDGSERAVVSSSCGDFEPSGHALEPHLLVELSRFAYVRRDGATVVLESPEARCRIVFSSEETWSSLGRFMRPTSIARLRAAGESRAAVHFADFLWRTGFLDRADTPESPARGSWEFHDLLFHWRTRGGRMSGPQGATYRHLHRWPPAPAIKARMSGAVWVLPKPDVSPAVDGSLVGVIERRRTNREQGDRLISLREVGRLLYHTLRVQRRLPGEFQELLLRPIPAAGAIHELEAYLVVDRAQQLDRGLYHYHAEQHTLHQLPAPALATEALLEDAALAWAKPNESPQILIILASRMPRLAWKYEGIAYRLALLNAGAAIQTLYLLATEMGLACSALGGGDSAVFSAATSLDPLVETSVAEFAVGASR